MEKIVLGRVVRLGIQQIACASCLSRRMRLMYNAEPLSSL